MSRPMRIKYLAPALHGLLFLSMLTLYWEFARALADSPARLLFLVLFVADFPISWVAFGVLFSSAKFGPFAALSWGFLGTLWWYLIGKFLDTRIRSPRRSPEDGESAERAHGPGEERNAWAYVREWIIAITITVCIVAISLEWDSNGSREVMKSGRVSLVALAPDGRSALLSRPS